jgi:hypothetical protein
MSDPLAFLDNEEANEPVSAGEPARVAEEPAREPVQPDPEPVIEAVQAVADPAPVASEPESQTVPLAALLSERDKRMAEQNMRRQLEDQIAALSRQPVMEPQEPPYHDPLAYTDFVAQQMALQVQRHRYELSEVRASVKHGEDFVQQAKAWAREKVSADPLYDARVDQSPDPFTVIVEDYKREQMLSQLTPDAWAQFQAWQAAQVGQPPSPQTGAIAAPPPSKTPFTSLKTVAQAGGVKPASPVVVQSDQEIADEVLR